MRNYQFLRTKMEPVNQVDENNNWFLRSGSHQHREPNEIKSDETNQIGNPNYNVERQTKGIHDQYYNQM